VLAATATHDEASNLMRLTPGNSVLGVAAAHRREIAAAPDPGTRPRELETMYETDRNPFPRAEPFGPHDLIDPRDTRPLTVEFVRLARARLATGLGQKPRLMRP
jgi:hypothetical protein